MAALPDVAARWPPDATWPSQPRPRNPEAELADGRCAVLYLPRWDARWVVAALSLRARVPCSQLEGEKGKLRRLKGLASAHKLQARLLLQPSVTLCSLLSVPSGLDFSSPTCSGFLSSLPFPHVRAGDPGIPSSKCPSKVLPSQGAASTERFPIPGRPSTCSVLHGHNHELLPLEGHCHST